jgi:hypothetical protein
MTKGLGGREVILDLLNVFDKRGIKATTACRPAMAEAADGLPVGANWSNIGSGCRHLQ